MALSATHRGGCSGSLWKWVSRTQAPHTPQDSVPDGSHRGGDPLPEIPPAGGGATRPRIAYSQSLDAGCGW
jgi:hypothetical protein